MARTQSQDYDKRCKAIVDQAAKLYAKHGFLGASVADLAKACGASKSLVYHYFPSKEDVLYGVMSSHLDDLVAIAETVVAAPGMSPDQRLQRLTVDFVTTYVGAASNHKVLLNELDNLPPDKRIEIIGRQRDIIGTVENLLIAIRPELADHANLKRPISMLFFGMINWMHTWYEPSGPVGPEAFATLATDLLLSGLQRINLTNHAS